MTIGEYFKCPLCGRPFCIKLQMDETYKLYDWPIHISCPDCGNEFDMKFNSKGLQPEELKIEDTDQCVILGYSAVLPLTKDLYFKDLTRAGRMAAFSPFMNFSFLHGNDDVTGPLDGWVKILMQNLIPYRHYLIDLLPIISHKPVNVKAFSTKLAALTETLHYEKLKDEDECLDAFFHLYFATYMNFVIKPYGRTRMKQHFNQMMDFIHRADKRQLEEVRGKIIAVFDAQNWLWKEALETAANIVNEIQTLLPSLAFVVVGKYQVPTGEELYTMTVGYKKLNDWFASCFEALVHFLPFMVGINNAVKNGDVDRFIVDGKEKTGTLADFARLDTASRINAIKQEDDLRETYEVDLNNHIRNAIQHKGAVYMAATQMVEYHYDQNDNAKHDDFRLIDVGLVVFMQLVHLIEAILLVTEMDKRLR